MRPIAPASDPQGSIEPIEGGIAPGRHRARFEYGNGDQPLAGYFIKRGLGVGGFGEVYHAQTDSGKNVALKRILRNVDIEMRGVQQCLNLRHPNLIALHDLRQDSIGQSWVVMELVEGESLRARIDRYPHGLPQPEAESLFAQLVAGVNYLHEQGLVHRDLKPANIFIENGLLKIGDYGLSKYISTSRRGGQTESVGTFHYMAPEIGRGDYGKEIDIYALGVIFFEMLTGNVPFDGESTQEIIVKHLSATPDLTLLSQKNRVVVGRALAKDPSKRFPNGKELLAAVGWEIGRTGLAEKSMAAEPSLVSSNRGGIFASLNPAKKARDLPTAKLLKNAEESPNRVFAQPVAESIHNSAEHSAEPLYQEPIANMLHNGCSNIVQAIQRQPKTTRNLAICAVFVLCLIFLWSGGVWLGMLGLFLYACYYPFYFFLVRPTHRDKRLQSAQCISPVPTVQPVLVRDRPHGRPFHLGDRLSAVASIGFLWSFLLTAYWFGWHDKSVSNAAIDDSIELIWVGVMVLAASWAVVLISPRELGVRSRFRQRCVQGVVGIALGTLSSLIYFYAQAPFDFEVSRDAWRSLFRSGPESAVWLSHIGFFVAWMFYIRWWSLTDANRRKKFSVGPVVLSSLIGAGVAFVMDFEMAWGVVYPALVTSLVQIGSPTFHQDLGIAASVENRNVA